MNFIRVFFKQKLTRISSILGMLASLFMMFKPDNFDSLETPLMLAFAAAFFTWMATEILDLEPQPAHPHDLALFKKINSKIPQYTMGTLKDHDFHGTWRTENLDGIFSVAGMKTSDDVFENKKIEKKWRDYHKAISEFTSHIALNAGTLAHTTELSTFKTRVEMEQSREISAQSQANMQKANNLAGEVYDAASDFKSVVKSCFNTSYPTED